ncbi:MAG: PAS domain S-box protein [Cyclobacteriaceae bacterium]|nr:PAS domain S-box protein [Cyclobacteriaceae bacterium]
MAIGKNVKSDKLISGDQEESVSEKKKGSSSSVGAEIISQTIETPYDMNVLLEVLDDACLISMTDKRGHIIYVNDKFVELAKYTREELIGQNHNIVRHEDMPKSVFKEVWATIGSGNIFKGIIKNKAKDGTPYWVDAWICPILGPNGKPEKYIGVRYDITEQIRAKEASEENEKRMNGTLDQAVDSIVTINSNKEITFYNEAAQKMFGYTSEEVMGQNVKMIVPIEHRRGHDEYVDSNIRTGINKVIGTGRDLEMVRKDGSKFWGNLSLSKVQFEGETQFTAFIKDITEEREQKNNLQGTLKAIDASFAFIEYNVDGTIITTNDIFLNTLGYSSQNEVEGKHHRIFCDSEYTKTSEYTKLWKDLGNGITQSGEMERVRKDGQIVWLSASYSPVLDEEGNVVKVMMLATNISDVKLPVLKVSEIIRQMAEGNITNQFEENAEGYVQEMGEALNTALANLNTLLSNIRESSVVVGDSAKTSLDLTENMKKNTREVAAAISQIAKGAQDQAMRTDESSKLVNDVLESSVDMQKKSDVINQTAERGRQSSTNGLTIMKALVENMQDISESAGMTSQSISVLSTRAEEIGRTLNVITDIAAQTNLLALNAAIEAARAGDAGRGFAVVAEEIRKLAEDSRKSAIDIEKIIGDVQKDTQSAGKAIENMTKSVKDGNTATKDAEVIFQEIASSTEETFSISLEIKDMSATQKGSVDAVAKNIEQIVVVAEETAAGAQQVASSSQELNSSMEEIGNAGSRLAEIAAELEAGINQFTLR